MINSVPKKIFGTLICAAVLWTTFTEGNNLNLKMEILIDQTSPDPYYKRYLKFMGSWFMGDQVGEDAVFQGVGGSDMTVAQHLYVLLPILKRSENLTDKFGNQGKNNIIDDKLGNQADIIENALLINEAIEELVDPKMDSVVKTAKIAKLNDNIFKSIEDDETVLIPISWKNNKPGSMLMTISKDKSNHGVLRIFDTYYYFFKNTIIDDKKFEYPQKIIPWREIHFPLDKIKRFKLLVLGLIILRDDTQLNQYYLEQNQNILKMLLNRFFGSESGRKYLDIGRIYLYEVFFPAFGKLESPIFWDDVAWPLNTFKMGPVGDILAYFLQIANNVENYPAWKLKTGYSILKLFLKRFSSDSDIRQETRSRIVVNEILKRSANRLLRDAFEMARVQNWIPSQVGESDNDFWKYLNPNSANASKSPKSPLQIEEKKAKLKLINSVMKLRKKVFDWIKENNLDTHKLRKLTRSLEQREMPVKQNIYITFQSTMEDPVDLTNYNSAESSTPDLSNCMSSINITIKSLKDFIKAFSNMKKVWHWSSFSYDFPFPHCKSFFRRNLEFLLKNLQLGSLDKENLARWAPTNQKEYNEFNSLTLIILNTISNLPSIDRTLEDYLIIMRIQRVAWRVAQALDSKFATIEPQRHLDLIQYSLSYPQCHRLLKNQMSYSNYFLADSGAFGNILDYNSVSEMKDLCNYLVEEEKSGKPVLNFEKYLVLNPVFVNFKVFDTADPGDREIYFKMAQNPKIAQTVRENSIKYNFGGASFAENSARAASLGYVGSQFIYYQFFDALKIVLASNIAFKKQVSVNLPLKLTYIPVNGLGSLLFILPKKDQTTNTIFTTVNEELIKKNKKSYIKTAITEMLTSHILGLDVIVNHIGRGSPKFWSSGNVIIDKKDKYSGFGNFKIIETLKDLWDDFIRISEMSSQNFKTAIDRLNLKAYRKDVAGAADFFLNCSAHLLRKLDVAPKYEELVMTLLMKTFSSVNDDLKVALKEVEKQDIAEVMAQEDEKEKEDLNNQNYKGAKNNAKEEMKANQTYLTKGKTSLDDRLKSLINWATIAIRFTARIRNLKPEWKDRYAEIPKHLYSIMIEYSRIQKRNDRRLIHLNKNLVAHVDYLLFMICSMNMNDHNLRLEIHTNLKPDQVNFPQDSSVLPAAMLLHRLLALSQYEYSRDAPLTEDFISNQFGINNVMKTISLLAEQNESFLGLMAEYMGPYLRLSPKQILSVYTQGDNLAKGALIYGRFSLNFIQGTFNENGSRARDPNSVLRYTLFREFFTSGNEQVIPALGKETNGCPNRYEVENFLAKHSKYSICEDTEKRRITIYRKIKDFRKPCMLVRRKRIINALQNAFSIYTNEGVDMYHCARGNNAHFVWIKRNSEDPSYISHGRLTHLFNFLIELFFDDALVELFQTNNDEMEVFQLDMKTKVVDKEPNWLEFLVLPRINFPKLEIREIDKVPVFPITAESKLMVVPEPMIRFSGGTQFGTYILKNKLVFMFQQFRFRDRPEVSLTFVESADGNLEMKGREDLKVCEDQIFENNFWPALMLRKIGESGERRFAYVPLANSEIETLYESKFDDEISCKYEPGSDLSNDTSNLNSSLIFMEEYSVKMYQIGETKTSDGKTKVIQGYKLKPTSRLQRLLLAFHNLRLRNYDVCLKLLDPRSEIDHNTPLSPDETKILNWMVSLKSGQEPEAYALRFMAMIHIILDSEIFPAEFDIRSKGSGENEAIEDISNISITDDESLSKIYLNKISNDYNNLDRLDIIENKSESNDVLGGDMKIGRYFAFLPLLPKRFHIDQVFREAMASQKIQKILRVQYNFGIMYPRRKPDAKLDFAIKNCEGFYNDNGYLSYSLLHRAILKPLSESEAETLKKNIENRFNFPYAAYNCDLSRLLVQKLLHIHDAKQNIPSDLQEMAVIYYNLSGNDFSTMDQYLYILSNPEFLSQFTIQQLRSMINLKNFEKDLEPVIIDGIKQTSPKTLLNEFRELLIRNTRMNIYYNPIDIFENNFDFNMSMQQRKTNPVDLLKPLLPNAPVFEKAIEEREINSIKFTSEDLHYIPESDRKTYNETIGKINNARVSKSASNTVKLAHLKVPSKTQKGLETAIQDYLETRTEPIEFDRLETDLFKGLKANIEARVIFLDASMKKLEAKYVRFYAGNSNSKQAENVLSSLKRIFNSDGIPELKDLRDCFMQMSRSCLRNRLTEMPESSIEKIAQLLKSYYIEKIIFNNLNAINEKIKKFDRLANEAAEAQAKLEAIKSTPKASVKPNETEDIEVEIFDYKDKALLSVEEIYVDMEKLLKLEQRLKDPVILNFEFMSAQYHLTKIQVMDIASLSRRNWEEDLKKKYMNLVACIGKKITDVQQKNFCKLVDKFKKLYPENKLESLPQSAGKRDQERLQENLNEIWSYMPRHERLIKSNDHKTQKETFYKERPVLEQLKAVGELQPYDTNQDAYFSRVIQRKMAAGKTTVLGTAATVKKADGKTLSVLVILSALYQSSAPDMQKRTSQYFNTRGFAFSMPKPRRLTIPKADQQNHPARNFLLWTLKTLINTINSNSYLIVTPETLQSFLNSYIEFLNAFICSHGGHLNPELSQCLHLFATIYDIFRSRGSIILDEIDSSMRPQKELNFPTTEQENILLSGVELTSDLLLHSALNVEINEAGLNLLANQQAALNNDQYAEVHRLWCKYITSQLKDKNSIWYKIFFPANNDNVVNDAELIKFFFEPSPLDTIGNAKTPAMEAEIDRLAEIKFKSERIFHVMMIVKMQLKNWLKNCFKGSVNEHYGPSLSSQSGQEVLYYAIPYMAANTPAEGSIFADRWETVNKTFMMYLVKNMNLEDISVILSDLQRTLSQGHSQIIDVKAEFKTACPGFDLLNLKFNAQNRLVDKNEKLIQCMKYRSPSALKLIFFWVTKIVFEKQQFYKEQITSNAINLTTMFPSIQGYSGTIDNVNILPHQVMIEAEIDHRNNEQANGAIAMKLLEQTNCVTTVQKIENVTQIDMLLEVMCRDFKDLSSFSAFIDAGALLKDFSNAEVAFALARKFKRDIILFYNERTNQISFHNPKNGPKHVAALEGSETKYLDSATISIVKNRFTYYDQRHITGSDILQPPTAKAFLTIGPKVLLRDILQGVMRMRQFQSGQSIHFVTTSAVETLLSKFSNTVKPITSDGSPRVDQSHLIALGALNEDEKQLTENVRLYRVKIDAEIRAFVLDRITEALIKADPFKERVSKATNQKLKLNFGFNHEELFKLTRSLFIRNVKENPVNWASFNTKIAASLAVNNYMNQRIAMIPDFWKTNCKSEWDKVMENLKFLTEEITENDKKDEANLVQKARSVLGYLHETLEVSEISTKFATYKSETIDLGSTVEMELQLELNQELKLELEQEFLDGFSEYPLAEPILKINLESNQTGSILIPVPGLEKYPKIQYRANVFELIETISGLLTPWKLVTEYANASAIGSFSEAILDIFRADIFCPGVDPNSKNFGKDCKLINGFVGLSKGLAKVSSSKEIDFVTMASREGTHLLFWRGRRDSSNTDYKYAVFLISGSEALSLHETWKYKSCLIGLLDSFWLTDLYGFEVHGSPFASTSLSSNQFSLLELEYKEHFIDLHFRALLLNASYNVIITSESMYDRMRAWVGDFGMMKQLDPKITVGVKREIIKKRVGFFINRLSWMSKLRDEIVPDDPFIRTILKIYANQPVDFGKITDNFKGHLNRGQTETYSDTMASSPSLIDSEDPKAKPWKTSKNINESEAFAVLNWMILFLVILVLVGIIFVWGRSAGINWPEFFETKWIWIISSIKKSTENAIKSVEGESAEGESVETISTDLADFDQIMLNESLNQDESVAIVADDEISANEN